MKNKLFYPLLIILLFSVNQLFAQGTNPPVFSMAAEYTKLIPNSPEAEAMAKYGIIPVTLYSGLPNVAIPIYDIHWGSLTLPISLTYNNNGYKPAEEASRVGMGWCLNAGGVITRVVNGMVDESNDSRRFDSYPNIYDIHIEQNVLDSIANGKTDGEPDVYIFNFNGITGKFIYINDHAYFSCQQDVKISMTLGNFQIITEDGTTYDFQDKETTSSHQLNGGYIPYYSSAWLLTSITSKDRKDIITFSYSAVPYQHSNVMTDMYTETHMENQSLVSNYSTNTINSSNTVTKELTSIDFGNNHIQFVQDASRRLDIQNLSTDKRALKSICVYDKNSTLIKKFNLVTGYFDTNAKLKLLEFRQVDNNDVLLNKYTFDYLNTGFTAQDTRGLDYWGFYNGKNNNSSLVSKADCPQFYFAGDRTPNFNSAQSGMLSTITYPTGGTTSFVYEPNYYSNGALEYCWNNESQSTHTIFNNSNNGGPVTTSVGFSIGTGQFVHLSYSRDIPWFSTDYGVKTFTPIVRIMNGSTQVASYRINYMNLQETDSLYLAPGSYTLILACESTALSTFATVGYVTQSGISPGTIGPGLRIKTISSNDAITNKNIVKSYAYTNENGASSGRLNPSVGTLVTNTTLKSEENGFEHDGYELNYSSGMRSGLGGMLDNEFYYNRVTETTADGTTTGKTTTDFNALMGSVSSVVPTKETVWKTTSPNVFTKVKETSYNYDIFWTYDMVSAKSRLSINVLTGSPIQDNPDLLDIIPRYHLYSCDHTISSLGYYRLKSETDNTYSDDPNDANINTSTKNYFYSNSKYSMHGSVFSKNSKGEILQNKTLFPSNYTAYSPSVTLDQIEENYQNSLRTISNNYAYGIYDAMESCLIYRIGSYWNNPDFIDAVQRFSGYKSDYFAAYRQVIIDRNTSLNGYYTAINNAIVQSSDPNTKALLMMQQDHIVNTPVEQMTYKGVGNTSHLTAAIKSIFGVRAYVPVIESIWTTELTAPKDSVAFSDSSYNYYKKKIDFVYDDDIKLIQQKKTNDVPRSYLWDYNKQYPIAEVINAAHGDIAYTSFEADETGGWQVGSSSRNTTYTLTGTSSYDIDYGLSAAGDFSTTKPYILSYWSHNGSYKDNITGGSISETTVGKTINSWTYYEHEVTSNGGSFAFNGSGLIDEVRLYPKGAQMTSFTYTPLVGMTAQNDAKSNITYYNYDNFGRLANITDADRNILKDYTYNYGANPSVTGIYYNTVRSQTFTKTGCGTGYTGTHVTYTVPPGTYSSSVSQADADQKALNDIGLNGQNYANTNGSCIPTATNDLTITLDSETTINDLGNYAVTIRDAGNNNILLNMNSAQITYPYTTPVAVPSNGYYSVTIVPDPSLPIIVHVNNVTYFVTSTHTWSNVSGNISILIRAPFF